MEFLLQSLSKEALQIRLEQVSLFRRSLVLKTSHGYGLSTRDASVDVSLCKGTMMQWMEQMDLTNLAHRSMVLAFLNSLTDVRNFPTLKGQNFLLQLPAGKDIAVIGRFPFVEKLRGSGNFERVDIFELDPRQGEFGPADYTRLSDYDVIFLTAMTLMNNTFDLVISHCTTQQMVIMGGPTTPMMPELFQCGVTHLAGSEIQDIDALAKTLGQGLSFRKCQGLRPVLWTNHGAEI